MKKLPSLHILNGDASINAFQDANLPGNMLVWREILSEGPVLATLPEQEFWLKRQEYILSTHNEKPDTYKEKVLNELYKLNGAGAFFEVILWFDADLMCQLNLLYLLQKLHKLHINLISVCTPHNGHHIALLHPEELQTLFDNREIMTPEQLDHTSTLWKLYAGSNPLKLQDFILQNSIPANLQKALQLHLSRFPDCITGLSYPETLLLRLLEKKELTIQELMEQFWQTVPHYGFGDHQLEQMVKYLQPELIQGAEYLHLTKVAEQVLQGNAKYSSRNKWLGGVYLQPTPAWCFDSINDQLRISKDLA